MTDDPPRFDAVYWLQKQILNMLRVRQDGIPIVGFTWYSITDQVDWDTALREDNGTVNALGPLRPRPQATPSRRRVQAHDSELGEPGAAAKQLPDRSNRHDHRRRAPRTDSA